MSPRLPFVIVFQAIEIERLSQELEVVSVGLRDAQKQVFNCESY
jgi:hypothetical protein